jgi:hypothetical protein
VAEPHRLQPRQSVLDRFIQLVRLMSEDVGSNTRPFLYKSYILEVRKSLAGEMIAFKIAMRRTNPRTFYLHLLKELLREIVNSGLVIELTKR